MAWLYLLALHGRFWQSGPILPRATLAEAPPVAVVIPARDEAAAIAASLQSLLAQDFPGRLRIILVDDGSTDGTGEIARALADPRLTVITGAVKPPGWSGKLFALAQGIAASDEPLLLLTDADILHQPGHLAALAAHAETHQLDMVSEMVELNCVSLAERALVPAFVFFFQLLYPFARVNNPHSRVAAAAGGTVLIRRAALERIGGIAALRGALIDDVALATQVKRGGPIWLGHSRLARSLRPYPGAADIWRMVARTAFVQLRHSWRLLAGTIVAMTLVWLAPPAIALLGDGAARLLAGLAWALQVLLYLPTLRHFGRAPLWALLLPLVALFYMAATLGSAIDHACGRGVVWKQRAYTGSEA